MKLELTFLGHVKLAAMYLTVIPPSRSPKITPFSWSLKAFPRPISVIPWTCFWSKSVCKPLCGRLTLVFSPFGEMELTFCAKTRVRFSCPYHYDQAVNMFCLIVPRLFSFIKVSFASRLARQIRVASIFSFTIGEKGGCSNANGLCPYHFGEHCIRVDRNCIFIFIADLFSSMVQ